MENKDGQIFNVLAVPYRRAFVATMEQSADLMLDKNIVDVDYNLNFDDEIMEEQHFDVLAVPCCRAFVVANDKKDEFLAQKTDPNVSAKMRANASKLNITDLTEKGPMLVKKRNFNKKTNP